MDSPATVYERFHSMFSGRGLALSMNAHVLVMQDTRRAALSIARDLPTLEYRPEDDTDPGWRIVWTMPPWVDDVPEEMWDAIDSALDRLNAVTEQANDQLRVRTPSYGAISWLALHFQEAFTCMGSALRASKLTIAQEKTRT